MVELNDNVKRMVEAMVRETVLRLSRTQQGSKSCLVLVPSYLADSPDTQASIECKVCATTIIHSGLADLSAFPANAKKIQVDDAAGRSAVASALHTFDSIICVLPSLSLLEKTAAGDDSDFYSFILTSAALRGRKASVFVGFDRPLQKGTFFDKVRNLLDGIEDMGLSVEYCCGTEDKTMAEAAPEKSLITEEDVINEFRLGKRSMKASKKTIVTPLAKDKANELGMAIEKVKE